MGRGSLIGFLVLLTAGHALADCSLTNLPTDFHVAQIQRDATGNTLIRWECCSNFLYSVFSADVLGADTPWTTRTNIFGVSGLTEWTDTTAATVSQRFYRVRLRTGFDFQDFTVNPNWSGVGNETGGNDYGYQVTNIAGGEAGEVGGTFAPSDQENYYAHTGFGEVFGFDKFFSASGRFDVANIRDMDGVLGIGFFSASSSDPSFIGLAVLESDATHFRVRAQSINSSTGWNVGDTEIKSVDGDYWFSIVYTPTGGVYSLGQLTVTVSNATSPAVTSIVDITLADRVAGGVFDSFGMGLLPWSSTGSGPGAGGQVDVFMDDVIYDRADDGIPPLAAPAASSVAEPATSSVTAPLAFHANTDKKVVGAEPVSQPTVVVPSRVAYPPFPSVAANTPVATMSPARPPTLSSTPLPTRGSVIDHRVLVANVRPAPSVPSPPVTRDPVGGVAGTLVAGAGVARFLRGRTFRYLLGWLHR